MHTNSKFLVALLVLVSFITVAAPGNWPMWRHDIQNTANQPLSAHMPTEPRVLAKYFIGSQQGTVTYADLQGTGKKDDIIIAARSRLIAYDKNGKQLWESSPDGYVMDHVEWVEDLDGDGHNEVIAVAGHMGITRQAYLILDGRTGKRRAAIEVNTGDFSWRGHLGPYIPGAKGKQIFIVTSMLQSEREGTRQTGEFALWSFDGEKVRRHWNWAPSEHVIYYPSTMVADLNGDGHFYAVVDSWCHVWTIDLATGKAVSHSAWDPQGANHRQYGWNELIDVDNDGKLDFVNISWTKHVDVLRNNNGKIEIAWTKGWPDPVTTEVRSLRCPSDPIIDLEGKSHKSIIVSVYEGGTDKRWHTTIFDAATGKEQGTMLDLVPECTVPLWGTNGPRAILCYRSSKLEFRPSEGYEAWRLKDGKLEKVWAQTNISSFVLHGDKSDDRKVFYYNAVNPQWATTADVDHDGRVEFFTRDASNTNHVQAWGANKAGEVVAKRGKLPVEKAPALPKRIKPQQGTTVPYLLAADLYGRGKNDLLLYDNKDVTVTRLEKNKLRVIEKFPSIEVPIVCDLLGDGKPYVLTGGHGSNGDLWVQARDMHKNVLWKFTLPHSAACGAYFERPHCFQIAHFTGGKQYDVFTYASKPGAHEYMLDGRTGKVVWDKEDIKAIERYFAPFGGRGSAIDFNHDGADDLVFLDPDYYCIADGKTGNLLVGPRFITDIIHWWGAYASPAVLTRQGHDPFIYLGGVYSSRGAIALDGTHEKWHQYLPTERWPQRNGNSGFNEGLLPPSKTRGWRGVQMEADGTIYCFDAENGTNYWKSAIPTSAAGIVTGDVDGDGSADVLFGGQDAMLYAIKDAGDHPETIWKKRFEGPVGTPLIADINGDGKSEIIVSVGDGNVYVLGQ